MSTPVIVGAARTAIRRSFKGTLANVSPEVLITTVLPEVVRRSGVAPESIDDIIFAESHYGGGDMARFAAAACGMESVPGQAVNRHCAGSLTAIGNAAAQIGSDRKSTRLNSSHVAISYAVFCLKKNRT